MAENTVKVDISFQSLLEAIASLGVTEKHKLWELLEAELFPDDEDSPEDIAEIQAARADYKTGDYNTFDQYAVQRANRSL
jgi:predicted hydrolase (HD superfamily)